jgi:hypothetical protein
MMPETEPSMTCGCGGVEIDIIEFSSTVLKGKCAKGCGKYILIRNPPSAVLQMTARMLPKKTGETRTVVVTDDPGVAAYIKELEDKLKKQGVNP